MKPQSPLSPSFVLKTKPKRGIAMSMVVVTALAVIVLVVVAVFFSGSMRSSGETMHEFAEGAVGQSTEFAIRMRCDRWCLGNTISLGTRLFRPPFCICEDESSGVTLIEEGYNKDEGGTLQDEE